MQGVFFVSGNSYIRFMKALLTFSFLFIVSVSFSQVKKPLGYRGIYQCYQQFEDFGLDGSSYLVVDSNKLVLFYRNGLRYTTVYSSVRLSSTSYIMDLSLGSLDNTVCLVKLSMVSGHLNLLVYDPNGVTLKRTVVFLKPPTWDIDKPKTVPYFYRELFALDY
jgi:hypothetical protein